jgi:fucose 4-O-acetylase-like acetyltransferase
MDGIFNCCSPPWRPWVFKMSFGTFILALVLISLFGLDSVQSVVLASAIFVGVVWQHCLCSPAVVVSENEVKTPLVGSAADVTDVEVAAGGSAGEEDKPPPRPRLDFLDNLKAALTVLVVYHHATGSVVGAGGGWIYSIGNFRNDWQPFMQWSLLLNQSYFMCLFFFISGYFSSSSLRKKGPAAFMADKMKRIGTPYVVWTFAIAPLGIILIFDVFLGQNLGPWWYRPLSLQCWFLGWLIILNAWYCLYYDKASDTGGGDVALRDPSPPPLLYVLAFALTVCFFCNTAIMVLGLTTVVDMPISVGSLPFDIFFFFGGTVLEQRKTLQHLGDLLQEGTPFAQEAEVAKIGAWATLLVSFVIAVIWFYMKITGVVFLVGTGFLLAGGMVFICYALVIYFYEYLNYTSEWTAFFVKSAYCVYIIHPLVVICVTKAWVQILASAADIHCEWDKGSLYSSTEMPTGFIFAGWVWCVTLSELIVWPLAHYLRKLPVVRDYL